MNSSNKNTNDKKDNDKKKDNNNPLRGLGKKENKNDSGGMSPIAIWGIVLVVAILLLNMGKTTSFLELGYSEFKQELKTGSITQVEFDDRSSVVKGKIKTDKGLTDFKVNILREDSSLMGLLEQNSVVIKVNNTNTWLPNLFFTFLSPLIFVLFLYLFIYRGMKGFGKGAMTFGKSKAKMTTENKVTFADVAGIDEAREEVEEIIDFLKNPKKYSDLGARLPKGVLLIGQPGNGKTLLAKAIAGEAGVPFFSLSGSDFVEMFVGVGASRVRDLFEQGKKNAPCIMFLDEIDAVGRHRGSGLGGGHDEREQTLNSLLVELDGFDSTEGVIMIAATNRPDVLDPALLRPGRFDRQITVPLPDIKAREEILRVHAKKVKMGSDVDLRRTARATTYFSGADLANLINEGALLAARRGSKEVNVIDLEEARDKVSFGPERKSSIVPEEDKVNTAWHEAGHALTLLHCKHVDKLHKVTIIPRGNAGGMMMSYPDKDRQTHSRAELEDRICIAYGGRVAEMFKFGMETSGAVSDIQSATNIARKMVCELGMSDLGVQAFGDVQEHMFLGREISRDHKYSGSTAKLIDETIKTILDSQYKRSEKIITDHQDQLKIIAEALLEYETLDGEEVSRLLKGEKLDRPNSEEVKAQEKAKKEKEEAIAKQKAEESKKEKEEANKSTDSNSNQEAEAPKKKQDSKSEDDSPSS